MIFTQTLSEFTLYRSCVTFVTFVESTDAIDIHMLESDDILFDKPIADSSVLLLNIFSLDN